MQEPVQPARLETIRARQALVAGRAARLRRQLGRMSADDIAALSGETGDPVTALELCAHVAGDLERAEARLCGATLTPCPW